MKLHPLGKWMMTNPLRSSSFGTNRQKSALAAHLQGVLIRIASVCGLCGKLQTLGVMEAVRL